jgi:MoCo/4Fe-4S cofactor protein with predicted Tat translocation signal
MSSLNQEPAPIWRGEDQLNNTEVFQENRHREFPVDASVLEDPISRRTFLKLMGASAALAGLAGCSFRRPVKTVYPYVKTPEDLIPGKTVYYATSMAIGEDVVGVLAESFEGRPIKLEGNPSHDSSRGFIKPWHQASVLELYDPDRLKSITHKQQPSGAEALEKWLVDSVETYKKSAGEGLYILTEAQMSPTFYRAVAAFQKKYPKAVVSRFEPINEDSVREGLFRISGQHLRPRYDFEKADVVVSFGSDFLGTDLGNLLYTNQFSKRRDPDSGNMNRLYAVESRFSITGTKADHRIPLKPSQVEAAVFQLAVALRAKGVSSSILSSVSAPSAPLSEKYIDAIVDDLLNNKGQSVLVGGAQLSPSANAILFVLNQALGNEGRTVFADAVPFAASSMNQKSSQHSIRDLAADLDKGRVQTLLILGGNPVYSAPADLDFAKKITKAKQSFHLTLFENETTALCGWAVPRSHYLESWSDTQSLDGVQAIVQPLIEPLYTSFQDSAILASFLESQDKPYEWVRETWMSGKGEDGWKKALHEGIFGSVSSVKSVAVKDNGFSAHLQAPKASSSIELVLTPSYALFDGRFANNGWLQELPDPITKLTWDNALLLNKKTATSLGVKSNDMVSISAGNLTVDSVVFVVPGQAEQSASLSLGFGRDKVGRVGGNTGFNGYALSSTASPYFSSVAIKSSGKTYKLATTQEHWELEERPVYRHTNVDDYKKRPHAIKEMVEHPPLVSSWEEKKYTEGPQWGMVIDLSKCTGCNGCITACQSENNIPIVGKKEVMNSREMHWIRVDRYFIGDDTNPEMVHQPMTCLQCEMAPCEQVCPVAATVHSEEGLNEMTYNRCVGTRYCANNCPAKVRRFNFFDFHQRNPQSVPKERIHFFDYVKEPDKTVQMQFNPDVTVRMRGVMEKCTYCIQRINEVKFHARNDDRPVRDGEIKTACQQTCPAEAIVFGDILDPNSKVSALKNHHRDYHVLAELNLKPRTSYLAGIRNPHPRLVVESKA